MLTQFSREGVPRDKQHGLGGIVGGDARNRAKQSGSDTPWMVSFNGRQIYVELREKGAVGSGSADTMSFILCWNKKGGSKSLPKSEASFGENEAQKKG